MIQRIQSIYLFLAAVLSGGFIFFVPLFEKPDTALMVSSYPIFLSMFLLSAVASLYSIFRFKNRQQQVVIGRVNIILNFSLLGFILYMFLDGMSGQEVKLGVASFVPVAVVILISLANRAIMKDETLVRAADRLR